MRHSKVLCLATELIINPRAPWILYACVDRVYVYPARATAHDLRF